MAQAGTGQVGYRVLGIYLNDHLAGATAGTELAHRVARTHRADGPDGPLKRLAVEVAQDRAALIAMMTALGVPVRSYKVYAAWAGEKAGRVKFNGRLLARSPLSDLEELELLRLGVEGKAAGWRTLRALADADMRLDPEQLDELVSRARRQADLLEELRCRSNRRSSARTVTGLPEQAAVVAGLLLDHCRDALADAQDADIVTELLAALLARGNGAAFQRAVYRRSGSLPEVIRRAAAVTGNGLPG